MRHGGIFCCLLLAFFGRLPASSTGMTVLQLARISSVLEGTFVTCSKSWCMSAAFYHWLSSQRVEDRSEEFKERNEKRCVVDVATTPIIMHDTRHHCLSCSDSSPLISSSWRHGAGHQTTYLPSWHLATMPEGFLNRLWGPSLEGSKFFNQSLEFFEVAVGHKSDGVSFEDMRWTEVYRGSSW